MLKSHRPPHFFKTDAVYFLTGRTFKQAPFFITLDHKKVFIKILNNLKKRYNIKLFAWVLLNNHYHLLFQFSNTLTGVSPLKDKALTGVSPLKNKALMGVSPKKIASAELYGEMTAVRLLSNFINRLHSITALKINQLDHALGRRIWYQYWDHYIRSEADFYKHFNYIHQNPIKHGLIKNLDEFKNYPFSSYDDWIQKKGADWTLNCFEKYPIKDFVEKSERECRLTPASPKA